MWPIVITNTNPAVSQDNQVFLWDIRKAAGPLKTLDQHNGGGASSTASSKFNYVNGN